MTEKKVVKKVSKKGVKKGDRYQCDICGLAVTVDEACGCAEACDITFCGEQMKPKRRT